MVGGWLGFRAGGAEEEVEEEGAGEDEAHGEAENHAPHAQTGGEG